MAIRKVPCPCPSSQGNGRLVALKETTHWEEENSSATWFQKSARSAIVTILVLYYPDKAISSVRKCEGFWHGEGSYPNLS